MSKAKITLWILLAVLAGARIALPRVLRQIINDRLAAISPYGGRVEDVRFELIRGRMILDRLHIKDRTNRMSLDIPQAAVHLHGRSLLRRRLVADVEITRPQLWILIAKPAESVPKISPPATIAAASAPLPAPSKSFSDLLNELFPFRIDRLTLTDGQIRVEDEASSGPVGRITELHIVVENLTNSREFSGMFVSTGFADARIMEQGALHLEMRIHPLAEQPAFTTALTLHQLSLSTLNPLLHRQWNIDVQGGTFELSAEAAAEGGAFKGYVKPVINNLRMIDLRKGKGMSNVVIGSVVVVLKNKPKDLLAGEIPFQGSFGRSKISLAEAIWLVFTNAVIKALEPSFATKAHATNGH